MLNVHCFTFNPFGESTYLVWDEASREAAVIDPGMCNSRERAQLDKFVDDHKLKLRRMIFTHLHLDHTFGSDWLKEKYGLEVEACPADEALGHRRVEQARMFGMPVDGLTPLEVEKPLKEGDVVRLGDTELQVIATPGHSPGGICLYDAADGILFSGDTLFQTSIGRTDLPGGHLPTLVSAIRSRLFTLPPSTRVYPGHGPSTTIGAERQANPYV